MKTWMKGIVLGTVLAFVLAGCAQPTKEMDAAAAAVEAAVNEGAEVYAKEDLLNLQADMTSANDKISSQGKKLFKGYGEAKDLLAQIKTRADELTAVIPAKKEEARNAALAALDQANAAVEEAKALLADAPSGKGTKADIDAMAGDIKAMEEMILEAQAKMDAMDFFGASDTAKLIGEKAAAVSAQIKAAIEKIRKK
ncbi:MAG: hypothetical protein KKD56_04140 [Acidobacteria bacterium]|nr:hypothetical protein [Acidobacteriota bacterium]MBU1338239.1 hypothetical protein [Acidobacteriota bacterium]MBU1475379.1 hypothetical protein [Acidobacteriota bacterium]MBU2439197.1 hypothetical protein [Acidobacteriota bacterium]MBU4330417.1 hypothetical protein [Acidobacteriota bacterium]